MRDAAPRGSIRPRATKTVLLAEDDAIVALDLKDQLLKEGYRVLGPYATGSEAIRTAKARRPDIAIIDHRLADGTAEALYRTLEQRTVPYVMVTVSARSVLPDDISPSGFLEKPFRMPVLLGLMHHALTASPA